MGGRSIHNVLTLCFVTCFMLSYSPKQSCSPSGPVCGYASASGSSDEKGYKARTFFRSKFVFECACNSVCEVHDSGNCIMLCTVSYVLSSSLLITFRTLYPPSLHALSVTIRHQGSSLHGFAVIRCTKSVGRLSSSPIRRQTN